jgi:hypothetical protein
MTTKLIVFTVFAFLQLTFCTENHHRNSHKNKHRQNQGVQIQPNVAHIQNNFEHNIKPFIERPFLPQEVENLSNLHQRKRFFDDVMSNAEIIGERDPTGIQEKPSLYSTVIESHNTSILHPQPQSMHIPTSKKAAFAFSSEGQTSSPDNKNLPTSRSMNIPVHMSETPIRNDPVLAGYETPQFEHKKMKNVSSNSDSTNINFVVKKEEKEKKESEVKTQEKMKEVDETVHDDINHFVKQFENKADKLDKIQILLQGKERLTKQADEFRLKAETDIDLLITGKKLALKLNNLLNRYIKKMSEDQHKGIRLSDEISLKNLLRDKLHREMQGLRVSNDEYKELEQLNTSDVQKIYDSVHAKLGN